MVDSLDYSELYHACDVSLFSFKTTKELKLLEHPIGQENALKAVDFGINIQQDGYNLYAMGPSGSGKHSTVMAFLLLMILFINFASQLTKNITAKELADINEAKRQRALKILQSASSDELPVAVISTAIAAYEADKATKWRIRL